MINNATLVAAVNFVTGDTGTITGTPSQRNAVISAAAAATDGKWLLTIGTAVAAADQMVVASVANDTNAIAGAGTFLNVTRLSDTTFEVAVWTATATPLNAQTIPVRIAIWKLDPL